MLLLFKKNFVTSQFFHAYSRLRIVPQNLTFTFRNCWRGLFTGCSSRGPATSIEALKGYIRHHIFRHCKALCHFKL